MLQFLISFLGGGANKPSKIISLKRKSSSFLLLIFNIRALKIARKVRIQSGGGKVIFNDYCLFGFFVFRGRKKYINAKTALIDGGGNLQFHLAESFNEADFMQKLNPLLANLDEESKRTLYKIISRLKYAYQTQQPISLLDESERNTFCDISQNFIPKIYKITSNIYFYEKYFLPCDAFEVSVMYHKHSLNILTQESLAFIRTKHIIDVGAYIGDSACVLQEFTDEMVHSFELDSKNYEFLLKTIELNNFTKVKPINKGLSSHQTSVFVEGCGIGSKVSLDKSESEINVITLDEYVKENNLQVGFIKVDIEGLEQEFIKGALNTIKTQKPVMLISIYHSSDDFFHIKPMIENLKLDYVFKIYKPIDYSVSNELALYCERKNYD